MLTNQPKLIKLNISSNRLTSKNLGSVIKAIRDHLKIEEIDISRLQIKGDVHCIMEISLLI